MRNRSKIGLIVLVLLLAGVGGFVFWATTGPNAQPEALAAMRSGDGIIVETEPWLIFEPTDSEPETGFIFYPGGRVDAQAYGPPIRAIAVDGFLVVVVPMPLDLAVLDPSEAADVMDAFPEIGNWAVGGHSLGGAMAASFADNHRDWVDGLILWAAYPAGNNDLSEADLAVLSIYGTRDGLATRDKIDGSRALLPPDTEWVELAGGNHAQFGWYGPQSGDNPATIGHLEQQEQIVVATSNLLKSLAE